MRNVLRSLLVAAVSLAAIGVATPAQADDPVDDLVRFLVETNLPANPGFETDTRHCAVNAAKPVLDPDPAENRSMSGRGAAGCPGGIQNINLHVRLYCATGTAAEQICGTLSNTNHPEFTPGTSELEDGWSYTTVKTHAAAVFTFAQPVTGFKNRGGCQLQDSTHVACWAVSPGTEKGA